MLATGWASGWALRSSSFDVGRGSSTRDPCGSTAWIAVRSIRRLRVVPFSELELALELASRQTTRRGSVFRTHEYQRRSSSLKVWYLDSPSRPETTGTPFAADVFLVLHVSRRHRKE